MRRHLKRRQHCSRRRCDLLDVACGTGLVTSAAAQRGVRVVGVDFSPNMVAAASELYPTLQFREADAEDLPFADGAFDAVVIKFGVHHFPFPVQALREAHRVIRPGGRLALTVWASPQEYALQKITLGALRDAGVAGAVLPTPPGGAVNEMSTCIDLLRASRFATTASQTQKLDAALWLESEQHLIDMLVHGTVRMSTVIRSQPPEMVDAIGVEIRKAAAAYRDGDGLCIPITARLAVGTRT
ncbi:class I SAM-dependent methyltransferase [Variovorax sp. J22R133]|uniref:class I SAM-dependent methyltransferase n=1 Tax=Variovorax brevis TaxID=3053503 RepID=UPI0025771C75|nr:class I SAM-dependent methyltransferase [Variovorax sp. J22R133]MDM0116738.1 class I SAM-dependent methyltransferase [Variovorax sp. J22R133]